MMTIRFNNKKYFLRFLIRVDLEIAVLLELGSDLSAKSSLNEQYLEKFSLKINKKVSYLSVTNVSFNLKLSLLLVLL